jgi:hypothetical protein
MISGKHTFLKRLHLYVNIKYLTSVPYSTEKVVQSATDTNDVMKAIRLPPPVRVRIMLVKVKRRNMGLPMYDLDEPIGGLTKESTEANPSTYRLDYSTKNDNPVSSNLFLDPVGNPFGIDQLTQKEPVNGVGGTLLATTNLHDNYTLGQGHSGARRAKKNQPNWMHFSQPVQKKFFEVLCSDTFMLSPDFTQANSGFTAFELEPPQIEKTGPNHPSVKYLKYTIPINERVEYTSWLENQGPSSLPTPYAGAATGSGLDMMVPKDKSFFDYKVIAMAYSPSDTQEEWKQRLNAYLKGPSAAVPEFDAQHQMGMSFSSCPAIVLNHYGVLETLDNE